MRLIPAAAVGLAGLMAGAVPVSEQTAAMRLIRLPDGGIQPQVAVDRDAGVHAVYFKGEPAAGDLFYTRLDAAGSWTPAVRVNSQAGSAIATGNVRGARMAIGRNRRIHVAWNGSKDAAPAAPGGATPMLYTRSNVSGTAFEPQRNVVQVATGLDGGGAVAADSQGRVFVAWHAGGPESTGEGDRRVWIAASSDEGASFAREEPVSPRPTGACGCCGMAGLVDRRGDVYLLYRSARDVVHRDTYLLISDDGGRRFGSTRLQEWNIGACPMSTFALAEGPGGVRAAWETGGQVQFARVDAGAVGAAIEAPGPIRTRRHPVLAVSARGDVLLAWTEGMSWQRGGSVAWQVFDTAGRPVGESGRAPGVPTWSLVAAYAGRDGVFRIVY